MFPNGAIDLAMYFLDKCNQQMPGKVAQLKLNGMTMKERLFAVVKARLEMIAPYTATWPQVYKFVYRDHSDIIRLLLYLLIQQMYQMLCIQWL
jgi:hypothetical protein